MICLMARLCWEGSTSLLFYRTLETGESMFTNCNSSPLQHLAAFAIVFVAAVVGTVAVGAYVDSVTSDAQRG
jgi:hypothetical protein